MFTKIEYRCTPAPNDTAAGNQLDDRVKVGYAEDVGSDGYLTEAFVTDRSGTPCYEDTTGGIGPFLHGSSRDCIHSEFAIAQSVGDLGDGYESWSKAYKVTIPAPPCKQGGDTGGGDTGECRRAAMSTLFSSARTLFRCGPGLGVPGLSATARPSRGTATVTHADGTSEPLGAGGYVLSKGDTIKTGKAGRAIVAFNDGSKVEIGPNSKFTLEGDRGFTLTRGVISASIKKTLCGLLSGKRCRVRTVVGIATVRGTVFTTEATKRLTRVRTYQGAVALRNTSGKRKRTVLVKKGFEGMVRGANPPTLARAG